MDPGTGLITVRFDQFLRPGTSKAASWSGRTYVDPVDRLFANALARPVILGSAVTFNPEVGGISGGPLTVSYSPPPWDLVGQCSLVRVQPFVDFPMSGPVSYPQFIRGVYQPLIQRWDLVFTEPITVQPAPYDPRVWAVKEGIVWRSPDTVTIGAGRIRLWGATFTGLEDTVFYAGGPPDWTDAEGDPVQGFTDAL